MKGIIYDMESISDSRELLESKPNSFTNIFIYIILSLLILGIVWSYFCKTDNYVRVEGIVRPNTNIQIVQNILVGKISTVNIKEGQRVKVNDVLYTLDKSSIESEKTNLKNEVSRLNFEINSLKKFKLSIETGKNLFNKDSEKTYYMKYLKYTTDLEMSTKSSSTPSPATSSPSSIDNTVKNKIKYDMIVDIDNNISLNQQNLEKQNSNLKNIESNIISTVVKAPINGEISIIKELNKGDIVQSGMEILSIIPNSGKNYKVQLAVQNKDIASIKKNQKIKCSFQALPSADYGEVSGKIINISTDSKIDQVKGASYYIVEASIENKTLKNKNGDTAQIKVGMMCTAQIITKTEKVMFWFLKKLNLM